MDEDELQPLDPRVAAVIAHASVVPPVDEERRRVLRQRLEGEVGSITARAGEPARHKAAGLLVIGAVLAAAFVLLVAWPSSTEQGLVTRQDERVEIELGDRGVAVVEPDSTLRWERDRAGAVVVTQEAGRVFYRVEPGGPFEVRTPHGSAHVRGTSFEVEVGMSKDMNRWKSMGIGAMAAAITVVTVYEGRVVLANDHGATKIGPGEQAAAQAADTPTGTRPRVLAVGEGTVEQRGGQMETARSGDEELRALRARLRELEEQLATAATRDDEASHDDEQGARSLLRRLYEPTADELNELARQCSVEFAFVEPRVGANEIISAELAEHHGLSELERESLDRDLMDLDTRWRVEVRGLYAEAVGDASNADSISPSAAVFELMDKVPSAEAIEVRRRLALERAGSLQPSEDSSTSLPLERLLRSSLSRSARTLEALTETLGRERAYDLLGDLPVGMHHHSGCQEDDL